MKKLFLIPAVLLGLAVAHGQINVSGGIFTNTTWTLANSPYIVIDTVVVFPGVTLTIQPGVIVKFANNVRLEIRQAKLIALGTATDSITFTSNSSSPTQGIWAEVFLNQSTVSKFNYCNFRYANRGIYNDDYNNINDSLIVKNSNFNYNNYGIFNWNLSSTNQFDSCNFFYNQTGFRIEYWQNVAMVNHCNFSYNQNNGFHGYFVYPNGCSGNLSNCTATYNSNEGISGAFVNNCISLNNQIGIQNTRKITNSTIRNNVYGIQNTDTVDNCTVNNNQYGINAQNITNSIIDSNSVNGTYYGGNISYCQIKYNGVGVYLADSVYIITKNYIENNSIGIELKANNSIFCNRICNNTAYDLRYTIAPNINVSQNYWCTPDSASTEVVIYDGYDNINYGLVLFMPIDSLCPPSNPTSINEITINDLITVFPNPFSTQTTLHTDNPLKNATLTLYNCFGQQVKQFVISRNEFGTGSNSDLPTGQAGSFVIRRDNLPSGLYFIRLTQNNKIITTDKLVITDK